MMADTVRIRGVPTIRVVEPGSVTDGPLAERWYSMALAARPTG
jgi:hypothetical protein